MAHDITIDAVRLALGMQQLRAEVAGANMPVGHPLFPELKTLRDRLSGHLQ